MTIAVLISTYGADEWKTLAAGRAFPSAEREQPDEIIVHHDPTGTAAGARNRAAQQSESDWLCFLDADDELGRGFIPAMRQSLRTLSRGPHAERVLFTPAVSYVLNGRPQRPKFWPVVPLEQANWLVIGTMISRSLFQEVGGFHDYGDPPGSNAFEDWATWARCHKAGARIVKVPRAVYVAHVDFASRHRGASHETRAGWHREIGLDLFPERYAKWTPPRARARRGRGRLSL